MPRQLSSIKALDHLLSGLEDLVLNASDSEVAGVSNVKDVRRLIDRHLAVRATPRIARKAVKGGTDERLALLRRLLAASGAQNPLLQAVFSSTEKPSSDQIEAAISELMKKSSKK